MGLFGQWKFNDGSGTSASDSSTSANPLTLTNMNISTAWSTDTPYSDNGNTNSLLLNDADTNDHATSGSVVPASVTGAGTRTLCTWAKANGTTGVVVSYGAQVNDQKFGLASATGNWAVWVNGANDVNTGVPIDTPTGTITAWLMMEQT